MGMNRISTRRWVACAAFAAALALPVAAMAQGGGGGGGGGTGGGGQGGGQGGQNAQGLQGVAGVAFDGNGVMRLMVFNDPGGRLHIQRRAAALAELNPDVAKPSELRMVSLNRLEAAVAEALAGNRELTDEVKYLAGLTRIQYVFFYPETNDIVIAGPAEGWFPDLSGRVIGATSLRPVLELQDLVVALRAFSPDRQDGPVIGCSIDPTQEGLAAMQAFLKQLGRNVHPNQATFVVDGLKTSLGLQTVRVMGIEPNTHFAQVMVEADYRMKLIGIGEEQHPVKGFKSYVDRASPAQVSRNALCRWYFVPNYDCVRVTKDELGMEMVGQGVKLVGAEEMVTASGQRVEKKDAAKPKSNKPKRGASQGFVDQFTKTYPELAQKRPVYAQLRNLIDMTVAAAFIQQHGYYAKSGWNMSLFGDESRFPVCTYETPVQVETAVTARFKGSSWMTPIGGGVTMRPLEALATSNLLADEKGAVQQQRAQIDLKNLKSGQWWWD